MLRKLFLLSALPAAAEASSGWATRAQAPVGEWVATGGCSSATAALANAGSDAGFGSLSPESGASACASPDGVTLSASAGTGAAADTPAFAGNRTLEMWVSFPSGFATDVASDEFTVVSHEGDNDRVWLLGSTISYEPATTCGGDPATADVAAQLGNAVTHIAATWSDQWPLYKTLSVDGVEVGRGQVTQAALDSTFLTCDVDDCDICSPTGSPYSDGDLLQLALGTAGVGSVDLLSLSFYDEALSQGQLESLYEAGPPDAQPSFAPSDATTAEDTSVTIDLDVSDANDEFRALTGDAFPASWDAGADAAWVTVDALPGNGTLVDGSGASVTSAGQQLLPVGGPFSLTFAPAPDGFSADGVVYESFDVTVGDGAHGAVASQTVSVFVTAVNDPPVPDEGLEASVYASVAGDIVVSGSDVDSAVTGVHVHTLPAKGTLSYYAESDGALTAVPSAAFDIGFSTTLVYEYAGDEATNTGSSVLDTDSFEFGVIDAEGLVSESFATLELDVLNSLFVDDAVLVADEDVRTAITLSGEDKGERLFDFVVEEGPEHGTLYLSSSGDDAITDFPATLAVDGGALDGTVGTRQLYYLSDADYFNNPPPSSCGSNRGDELDVMQVRLAYDQLSSQQLGVEVLVNNVNDPAQISGPSYLTHDVLHPTEFAIELDEPDLDCYDLELTVSATNGYFSFVPENMARVAIQSDSGDGWTDTALTFTANASSMALLLQQMWYEEFVVGNTFDMRDATLTFTVSEAEDASLAADSETIPVNNGGVIFDTDAVSQDLPAYLVFGLVMFILLIVAVAARKIVKVVVHGGHEKLPPASGSAASRAKSIQMQENPLPHAPAAAASVSDVAASAGPPALPGSASAGPPAVPGSAADEWLTLTDDASGDSYYVNKHTRRTTWTKPDGL